MSSEMHPVLPPCQEAGAILAQPGPAWIWDVAGRRILSANAAALDFWGVRRPEQLLAVRFDRAMPAVQRLEQMGHGARIVERQEQLLFWTARGRKRVHCLCGPVDAGGFDGRVLVRVLAPEIAALKRQRRVAGAEPAEPPDPEMGPFNGHAAGKADEAAVPITIAPSAGLRMNGAGRPGRAAAAPALSTSEAAILTEIARRVNGAAQELSAAHDDEPGLNQPGLMPADFAPEQAGAPNAQPQTPVWSSQALHQAPQPDALPSGVAQIAHEVRTPLTAIIGFAEIMRDEQLGAMGNERYLEYASDILESARHALDVVEDLLDVSRLEGGNFVPNLVQADLTAVVQSCLKTMVPIAGKSHVVLSLEADTALPAVIADRRSLKQMLLNLMANGVRFAGEGGRVAVEIGYVAGGGVSVSVRDTGAGMSTGEIEAALGHNLDHVPRPRLGGTGIGLPLTKALAEANGLQLSIASVVGQGTEASITFPPHSMVTR